MGRSHKNPAVSNEKSSPDKFNMVFFMKDKYRDDHLLALYDFTVFGAKFTNSHKCDFRILVLGLEFQQTDLPITPS